MTSVAEDENAKVSPPDYDEILKGLARNTPDTRRLNRIEACKTYIEQTKLLVTLASAFVVAPAAIVALEAKRLDSLRPHLCLVLAAECAFVASVLAAYFVLGSLAGSQHKGTFNVYRPFTMLASVIQLVAYLGGLLEVVWLIRSLVTGAA
jgi:hypothetical protein